MPEQRIPIVGSGHQAGAIDALRRITVGEEITLRRDRGNVFDVYAVRCYWGDQMLGFLPRGQNVAIAEQLSARKAVKAVISSLPQFTSNVSTGAVRISDAPRLLVTWE